MSGSVRLSGMWDLLFLQRDGHFAPNVAPSTASSRNARQIYTCTLTSRTCLNLSLERKPSKPQTFELKQCAISRCRVSEACQPIQLLSSVIGSLAGESRQYKAHGASVGAAWRDHISFTVRSSEEKKPSVIEGHITIQSHRGRNGKTLQFTHKTRGYI